LGASHHHRLDAYNSLSIGVVIQFLQVFTGISLAVYYMGILYSVNLKFDAHKSALLSGLNTLALWLGTVPTILFLDRVGRRVMLMWGSTIMAICMTIFTVCVAVPTTASAYLGIVVS
jgi:MFS family permease